MKGRTDRSPFSTALSNPSFFVPALLSAAVLLLFNRFLDPTGHWVLSQPGDLTKQFVWWRQFGFEELRKGHLALWNPHLFCGAPFFGGFQSALLYPPNWLFMVLPLAFALNLSIALHVFLAGWFTYLWLKGRGNHPASALLGALMVMFSGAFFTRLVVGQHPNLCTMVWIPLVFLALDKFRETGRWRWVLLGEATVALQIFAGHIQYCYYAGVTAAFYVLWTLAWTDRKLRYLLGFFLVYAGAGFLAAVQLLAGWDAASQSVRALHLSIGNLDVADMTVERIWCLLMPNFFGSWNNFWGGGMYWEGNPYMGVTGFLLALHALKTSPRPEKKAFIGLAIFITLLCFGRRTPLFALFVKYFPLFGNFRGVSKLFILATLFLAALAASGLDEIFKRPEVLPSLGRGAGRGALAFGIVSAFFFAAPRLGWGRLFKQFLDHADGMAWSLLGAALLLAGIAGLAFLTARRAAWRWGFLALTFLELFSFAWQNRPSFDLQALEAKASLIQKTYQQDPGDYRIWVDNGNYALGMRGFDVWGEDPLNLYRYARFAAATQGYDLSTDALRLYFFQKFTPALDLLRLRYIFRDHGAHLSVEKSGLAEVPRAYWVSRFEVLPESAILDKTVNHSFNPRSEVLLEQDPGLALSKSLPHGELEVRDLTTDKLEVKANTARPALLVISDNYSPGWKVEPITQGSQKQYRVLPANGFQRAIPLAAGSHHFYLEYRPTAFVVGKWISIFSWLALLALFPFTMRNHENRR